MPENDVEIPFVNKASVSAEGTIPVLNGKADFSLSATATFQPNCTPPMVFSDVTVTGPWR